VSVSTALFQPPGRKIAVAERARRRRERLVPPELTPDGSGAGAIQLATDPERGSPDHVEREHAPGRSVELDRDAIASLASQRRYAWHSVS
jgi:hypothetical protein